MTSKIPSGEEARGGSSMQGQADNRKKIKDGKTKGTRGGGSVGERRGSVR